MSRLRWGILGWGAIAARFASAVDASAHCVVAAVGTGSEAKAHALRASRPQIEVLDYEGLVTSPDVDAIYIATPHPFHARWAIAAADAGKHVLCEKPLGMNQGEGMAIVEAAQRNGIFLMEAFMYRTHPQIERMKTLLPAGAIGQVRMIDASFGYVSKHGPEGRQINPELGGGSILDVGCYVLSMARLVAGCALGLPFADPIKLQGEARLEANGIDAVAGATLRFPGDILAQISCSVRTRMRNRVTIMGDAGILVIEAPWFGSGIEGGRCAITIDRPEQPREKIEIIEPRKLYAIEADLVAASIASGAVENAAMPWDDTLGNLRGLDQWRASVGLEYASEQPERQIRPFHGRPLARRASARMPYARIEGLSKPLSRLALGSMRMHPMSYASAMLDEFYECGGNVIETAYKYSGGKSEEMIGHWVANRGVRDEVVLITKGAETPFCHPKDLTEQLLKSLERLRTDHVDVYMMHRDNEEYPVSVWIDLLNEHQRAGRFRIFGVSNWRFERIDAANDYARRNGLNGITVMSNNFSLARMIEAPWPLCRSASEPDYRAWLERTRMPSFPWSSQARGFFTERAAPDKFDAPELVRCWYSPDNFERKRRAGIIAAEQNVETINAALAYVLAQPFPTFPIVGPLTLAEWRSCLGALDVRLTVEDVAWLDLARETRTTSQGDVRR